MSLKVPNSLLREIIRFTCPSSITNYSIWFKNFRPGSSQIGFCGRAYINRKHVICRIPRHYIRLQKAYNAVLKKGKGYRPWYAYTYEEALVAIVAHELNHLAQAKNPRLYRRTWGARGRFSELDCDAYAIRMLRAWRAQTSGTQAARTRPKVTNFKPLTPRQRLEGMAAPHGIQIDFGSPSPDCIWIGPPSTLCDEDGVMQNDPYESEGHTHFDYHSAKQAIEKYVQICIDLADKPVMLLS